MSRPGKSIKSALDRRMEMPIGEKPAARVKRASVRPSSELMHEQEEKTDESPPPVVLGDIVERKRPKRKIRKDRATPENATGNNDRHSKDGFPSLSKPIGTYLNKKPSTNVSKPDTALATSAKKADTGDLNDIETLKQASAKDANALLAQMSEMEIKENQMELQKSLTPELIALLKSRPQKDQSHPRVKASENDRRTDTRSKEEELKFISSIKTLEELDAAYDATTSVEEEKTVEKDDFAIACDLLRSTVPRQNLWAAKTIRDKLIRDYEVFRKSGSDFVETRRWPYPPLLSVSLRCLLDTVPSKAIVTTIHQYVLESILILVKMRCPMEYRENVEYQEDSSFWVHQNYFLDDVVPVRHPSLFFTSHAIKPLTENSTDVSAAYATASSSKSAASDGELFVKDPMWTLVSKMKIIPRFDEILKYSLPEESLCTICDMLTLISSRSAGAAGAISMHPTLLGKLFDQISDTYNEQSIVECTRCLPIVVLFCTLLRQTRSAAESLSFNSFMLRILSQAARNEDDVRLQRTTFLVFRLLNQYGIHVQDTVQILSLLSEKFTKGSEHDKALAKDVFAALAVLLGCIGERMVENKNDLVGDDYEIVKSIQRILANVLDSTEFALANRFDAFSAALYRCFHQLIQMADFGGKQSGMLPDWFTLSEESLRRLLASILDGTVIDSMLTTCLGSNESSDSEREASSFAFIIALLDLVEAFKGHDSVLDTTTKDLFVSHQERIAQSVASALRHATFDNTDWKEPARHVWSTTCAVRLIRFALGNQLQTPDLRRFVISLIGRLQLGQEALANFLINTGIFSTTEHEAILSALFQRELIRTSVRLKQLEHSQLSMPWFSGTSGTSARESLLPYCSSVRSNTDDLLLPLGSAWLWHYFSGAVSPSSQGENSTVNEAGAVIRSAIRVIIDNDDCTSGSGKKIYHLMNLAMQPENVQAAIAPLHGDIEELYYRCFRNSGSTFPSDFVSACAEHSKPEAVSSSGIGKLDDTSLGPEEKAFLELLEGDKNEIPGSIGKVQTDALKDFASDLCTQITEKGDKHLFAARFIRIFFLSELPSSIRCDILMKLRGLLHLLTIDTKSDKLVLSRILGACAQSLRHSMRDGSEYIDLLCRLYSTEPRIPGGFFHDLVVATISKNILMSIWEGSNTSTAVWRRRLDKVPSLVPEIMTLAKSLVADTELTSEQLIEKAEKTHANWDGSVSEELERLFKK